ncbi:MAG: IS66 family insertion sequence element accessory protein TnpB [Coriobacteriales bacterium]
MNPFSAPDNIYLARRPQDMRCGINRLSATVMSELDADPADGSLYVFVSKDATKCKMLKFDDNGWVLYYCTMCEGTFKWGRSKDGSPALAVRRSQLAWLLDGLSIEQPKAARPIAARMAH